jgi:hypothetical protein
MFDVEREIGVGRHTSLTLTYRHANRKPFIAQTKNDESLCDQLLLHDSRGRGITKLGIQLVTPGIPLIDASFSDLEQRISHMWKGPASGQGRYVTQRVQEKTCGYRLSWIRPSL